MYTLTLTASEETTLRFIASRGYSMAVWEAWQNGTILSTVEHADGGIVETTVEMPEHLVWVIPEELDNNGGHGFGPVAGTLREKLNALLDSIV